MADSSGRLLSSRASIGAAIFFGGITVAILIPFIQASREAARRMSCSDNLKGIGLAFHNYHAAFKVLPPGCGGTGPTPGHDAWSNQRRLSPLVGICPFIESSQFWSLICDPFVTGSVERPEDPDDDFSYAKSDLFYRYSINDRTTINGPFVNDSGEHYFPAMGPAPWLTDAYPPWQMGKPFFYRCPSDPTQSEFKSAALSNYAICYGDGVHEVGYQPGSKLSFRDGVADTTTQRGAFVNGQALNFRDITDGLGYTIFAGEVATYDGTRRAAGSVASNIAGLRDNPSLCLQTINPKTQYYKSEIKLRFTPDGTASRGGNWADGAITWSGFTTVLPPNSPSCDTETEHRLEGVFSASSNHQGGCHILMGDGAVIFIVNSIDTGDLSSPSVYSDDDIELSEITRGVWAAIGTRNTATSPNH